MRWNMALWLLAKILFLIFVHNRGSTLLLVSGVSGFSDQNRQSPPGRLQSRQPSNVLMSLHGASTVEGIDDWAAEKKQEQDEFLENSRNSFLAWAKDHVVDLSQTGSSDRHDDAFRAFTATIQQDKDIRVVALSEGCHNSKEQMQLHRQLVEYLVRYCNFTVVATETGFPESRLIYDYVSGKDHEEYDKNTIYQKGLNKMYGAWKEGIDLIEWMREYNQKRTIREKDEKPLLKYYGIDIGGFYQDWKTPMTAILTYLQRHVYNSTDAFRILDLVKQWTPFLKVLERNARSYYTDTMTTRQRMDMAILLEDTLKSFEDLESSLVQESGRFEYEWARQSLLSIQWAEAYYRNYIDRRQEPTNSKTWWSTNGLNGREIAMYQNIQWVLQQHPSERIIWINHVAHTKTDTQYQGDLWGWLTPAGAMLQESIKAGREDDEKRQKERLYSIGLVYGSGEYWKDWQQGPEKRSIAKVPCPSAEHGLEATLGSLVDTPTSQSSTFFIPWNKAPASARPWMQTESEIRENDYVLKVKPCEWQGCIYIDKVSPATPKDTDGGYYE